MKPAPQFAEERALAFAERRQLLSRDLAQNLLYPRPQVLQWIKPTGARVAFLISMEDDNGDRGEDQRLR